MFSLVILRLLETYFRHRWLYLLPAVLMTIVAAIYPFTLEPAFVARGNIYIQNETLLSSLSALPNDGFGWVTPAQATASEMNELFRTDAFLQAIIQQTDLGIEIVDDPYIDRILIAQVRSSIWVHPLGNNLLSIAASHARPRIAYQLSSAVINTYVQWKINLGLEGSMAAQTFFIELVDDYQAELEPARRELTDYLTAHPEPLRGERPASEVAEIARLQVIVDQRMERLRNAEGKEENARLAMVQTESDVRQTYFTIDDPILPRSPERSLRDIAVTMAACIVAGMILTGLAIVGSALLDRTFRFPIDIRHGLALPVLAQVYEAELGTQPIGPRATSTERTSSEKRKSEGQSGIVPPKRKRSQRMLGFR